MLHKLFLGIILLPVLLAMSFVNTQAASDEQILLAIESGIPWLAVQQGANGSWGSELGITGFAVFKLEEYAYENGVSPFDTDYPYYDNVIAGLDYIFRQTSLSNCGSGIVYGAGHHETYSTGIAMMAVAGSREPDRVVNAPGFPVHGMTYMEVLQANVDYFECAQLQDGGWRYWYLDQASDNSNTGYAVLGLRYAEDFGVPIPDTLKQNLSVFIDAIQDDVNGDPEDGGSHYTVGGGWVNLLKTGNLLFEMAFVGDAVTDLRVQDALDYIDRHWNDPNPDPGWQNHNQAMYCLMKGFEAFGIEQIEVGGSPVDWFQEFADQIIYNQQPDGYWNPEFWGNAVVSTEWALLTLEKSAPPPVATEVPVDVKPTSCRNPINTKGKGVTPVAVLGTEDFDVTQVDPVTVVLMGVAPLRWSLEDVATPFEPYVGKEDAFDCTTEGPDGYMDLVFHFDTQELIAALDEVEDNDVLVLQLTGNLLEDFNGIPIIGEDVIVILDK